MTLKMPAYRPINFRVTENNGMLVNVGDEFL
jgi:hypothetical protein